MVLSVIKRLNTNHLKNDSIFTFGVQMWFAMQITSLTPNEQLREQVIQMTNHSTKYYCALLVSRLVM